MCCTASRSSRWKSQTQLGKFFNSQMNHRLRIQPSPNSVSPISRPQKIFRFLPEHSMNLCRGMQKGTRRPPRHAALPAWPSRTPAARRQTELRSSLAQHQDESEGRARCTRALAAVEPSTAPSPALHPFTGVRAPAGTEAALIPTSKPSSRSHCKIFSRVRQRRRLNPKNSPTKEIPDQKTVEEAEHTSLILQP
jgi:hypothetical protein